MKLTHLLFTPIWMAAVSNAFSIPQQHRRPTFVSATDYGSDFGTAMPPKPKQTLEEKISAGATEFIATVKSALGEGVEPPAELDALIEARDSGAAPGVVAARVYELMIEQGMNYDVDPDTGVMTPTEWDIKSNLEVPEVKREFDYLYKYGMGLIQRGLVEMEEIKSIVQDRLVSRTGMTPEEFDKWLGY